MQRWGWDYAQLIGIRFAINVMIASVIVWVTLRLIGDSNPIWAIASMVAASEPEITEAKRFFRARLINVAVGCAVGLFYILVGGASGWMLPLALATAVLVTNYLVRVKTMWRQAPITAAVVIAAGVTSGSDTIGMTQGIHKVLEVVFGCLVGLGVSWTMSKVWLVKPPARTGKGQAQT